MRQSRNLLPDTFKIQLRKLKSDFRTFLALQVGCYWIRITKIDIRAGKSQGTKSSFEWQMHPLARTSDIITEKVEKSITSRSSDIRDQAVKIRNLDKETNQKSLPQQWKTQTLGTRGTNKCVKILNFQRVYQKTTKSEHAQRPIPSERHRATARVSVKNKTLQPKG
jgi:hypothetical protein